MGGRQATLPHIGALEQGPELDVLERTPTGGVQIPREWGFYIRSLLLGAARMILSTLSRSSAASLAELTTAFFSL